MKTSQEISKPQDPPPQIQEMEPVVTLTAGIAHNFNNILQGIIGYTELLLKEKTEKDPDYEYAMHILKCGERAADLVRRYMLNT